MIPNLSMRRVSRVLPFLVAVPLVVALGGCVSYPTNEIDDSAPPAVFEAAYDGGVLQPLSDGFPAEPITLVAVDDPGSRDDIYARTLDRALKGISPVEIVVSDEPRASGGTFHALADTLSGPRAELGRQGYFPVILSIPGAVSDFSVEPIEEELGRGLDDVSMLVSTETQPFLLSQRADAPWGESFQGFIDYARAHPGKVRYISPGVGSGLDIAMEWMIDALGLKVHKIPAANAQAAMMVVASGEGDVTMSNADLTTPNVDAGRVSVIWSTTTDGIDEFDGDGVASAGQNAQYGLPDDQWGIVMALAVPTEVAPAHRLWLEELFRAAAATPEYQNREETTPGLEVAVQGHEQADELARESFLTSDAVIRRLGLHFEEK